VSEKELCTDCDRHRDLDDDGRCPDCAWRHHSGMKRYNELPRCQHCGLRLVYLRGICRHCYHDTTILAEHLPLRNTRPSGDKKSYDVYATRPLPQEPTRTLPGTPERMAVYRERYEQRVQLHHPSDLTYKEDGCVSTM
jgi:hypothetical protein